MVLDSDRERECLWKLLLWLFVAGAEIPSGSVRDRAAEAAADSGTAGEVDAPSRSSN